MDANPATAAPAPTPVPLEQRKWALACHLAAVGGILVPWFGLALGPLVAWLALRREHPSVEAHGREALNFGLSMMIWVAAASAVAYAFGAWFPVPVVLALWVTCVVVACMKANGGELYRYPITIRFVA
jgi:uncharacterized Tic20 family protein